MLAVGLLVDFCSEALEAQAPVDGASSGTSSDASTAQSDDGCAAPAAAVTAVDEVLHVPPREAFHSKVWSELGGVRQVTCGLFVALGGCPAASLWLSSDVTRCVVVLVVVVFGSSRRLYCRLGRKYSPPTMSAVPSQRRS